MSRFRNQESMMDRITNLETHLREICYNLASYSRKIAKTRDEGDLLASSITKFAEEENVNSSLRYALTHFADCFSAIQDQRNTEVFQLEGRIIQEMSVYGELCKKAKEETRKGLLAKTKAGDIARSSSINEIHNAVKMYEFQIDRFEQRKLSDLKKYFKELIQIEMYFHAKSVVEEYSRVIRERYPQITVVGENHTPNFIRLAIAQTLSFGKFVVIGLIVSNINPFSYFGMITPTYWNMLAQHRLYGSMMIFFICNTLESYLMSTGAFEITYNGVLIWSKLKNGRMISPQELFSLISLEEDLTKGNILDYNPTS